MRRIHQLASATGKLELFIVFGSYVTTKAEPRDVDVVLVMKDDFFLAQCDETMRVLFDHQRAETELGASIFWLCPKVLLRGSLEDFLLGWGTKFEEEDWVLLERPDGGTSLSFQTEACYVRPVWPGTQGEQLMMLHLDIEVDDLDEAGAHAVAQGAVLAEFQPQDDVRVYLDPAGHPFCLWIAT